jgi:hypothetical protein
MRRACDGLAVMRQVVDDVTHCESTVGAETNAYSLWLWLNIEVAMVVSTSSAGRELRVRSRQALAWPRVGIRHGLDNLNDGGEEERVTDVAVVSHTCDDWI